MKHFINVLVILLLCAMAVGIAYEVNLSNQILGKDNLSMWGFLYIPLMLFMSVWGIKIHNDYR